MWEYRGGWVWRRGGLEALVTRIIIKELQLTQKVEYDELSF
jgi:hypothetical protein